MIEYLVLQTYLEARATRTVKTTMALNVQFPF